MYVDYEDDETELLYPDYYRRKYIGMRIRGMRHKTKASTEWCIYRKRNGRKSKNKG